MSEKDTSNGDTVRVTLKTIAGWVMGVAALVISSGVILFVQSSISFHSDMTRAVDHIGWEIGGMSNEISDIKQRQNDTPTKDDLNRVTNEIHTIWSKLRPDGDGYIRANTNASETGRSTR